MKWYKDLFTSEGGKNIECSCMFCQPTKSLKDFCSAKSKNMKESLTQTIHERFFIQLHLKIRKKGSRDTFVKYFDFFFKISKKLPRAQMKVIFPVGLEYMSAEQKSDFKVNSIHYKTAGVKISAKATGKKFRRWYYF